MPWARWPISAATSSSTMWSKVGSDRGAVRISFTAGLAASALATCYWVLDTGPADRLHRLAEPFVALGRNAILLFVLSGLIAKSLIYLHWPDAAVPLGRWLHVTAFEPLAAPRIASLLFAIANLLVLYGLLAVLHRKRIYLTV